MEIKIEREYNYEDIYLRPQRCIVDSRSDCDISVEFGGIRFRNPVIASNMKSVVNFDTCRYFAKLGMFYIMHRFDLVESELIDFITYMNKNFYSSISIGIKQEDFNFLSTLKRNEIFPTFITIDIANAFYKRVVSMIDFIKLNLPSTFIIAGNVATNEGVHFLEQNGADAVKIFQAPGAACSTKVKTGFTRGTISCLLECSKIAKKPIIADGGIREPGHIAKAVACGATMIMAGSFMSGFDQSPGNIINIDGHKKYSYYGSASFKNTKNHRHVEGKEILLDYKGNMDDHIYDIECSLKSSVSYAGGKRLEDLVGTPIFAIN